MPNDQTKRGGVANRAMKHGLRPCRTACINASRVSSKNYQHVVQTWSLSSWTRTLRLVQQSSKCTLTPPRCWAFEYEINWEWVRWSWNTGRIVVDELELLKCVLSFFVFLKRALCFCTCVPVSSRPRCLQVPARRPECHREDR